MTIKYLLLDTKGEIFDRLLDNIQYHSLSDLLLELMQLYLRFELYNAPNTGSSEGSSLVDETETKESDENS